MMRRDYILRMVAEMAQVLSRVMALKGRQEYEQALREIDRALRDLRDSTASPTEPKSLENWIRLCRSHEAAASGLMVAVADLLREQGDLKALRQVSTGSARPTEAANAHVVALGLLLEALLNGETFVSAELLDKVEHLIEMTRNGPLESGVWSRLVQYLVARGQLARAEDVLFEWAESGDTSAAPVGEDFYSKLALLADAELEQGGLARAEVEPGWREFKQLIRS